MAVILLRGFSHSGKDFIGNLLCNKYEYTRFAFADSLKNIVAKNFNCSVETLHSQEGKLQICESDTLKRTYRQILIDEALRLRNINANVFVEHCCQEIKKSSATKIVITDWRYTNEISIIQETFPDFKVYPVHVVRTNQTTSPVDDISEHHLDKRTNDYILHNTMDHTINNNIHKLASFINYDLSL